VTLTLTVTVNGGTTVSGAGWADPTDLIEEFNDTSRGRRIRRSPSATTSSSR
jgi:hypothetical protein